MNKNNKYIQITQEERVIIADLWRRNKSKNYISKWLKRSWDTIDKEIKRNRMKDIKVHVISGVYYKQIFWQNP